MSNIRPWTLRNIKERSLPRGQLRTVDDRAERQLARLALAPINSEHPILGKIDESAAGSDHKNLTRYPRKLKQIRRAQICEYEAMEELVGIAFVDIEYIILRE